MSAKSASIRSWWWTFVEDLLRGRLPHIAEKTLLLAGETLEDDFARGGNWNVENILPGG